MAAYQERRQLLRVPFPTVFETLFFGQQQTVTGIDISEGGLRYMTDLVDHRELNELVFLELRLDDGEPPAHVLAEVKDQWSGQELTTTSVEFIKVLPRDFFRIRSYVENRLRRAA